MFAGQFRYKINIEHSLYGLREIISSVRLPLENRFPWTIWIWSKGDNFIGSTISRKSLPLDHSLLLVCEFTSCKQYAQYFKRRLYRQKLNSLFLFLYTVAQLFSVTFGYRKFELALHFLGSIPPTRSLSVKPTKRTVSLKTLSVIGTLMSSSSTERLSNPE